MATATASASAVAPQKSTHPFTCMSCSIAFRSSELQRTHMRSDWHRYNLKRRVASLPPLSSEVFAEKVLSAQASSRAAADKASYEKHCQACNKTYFSDNAFRNHLGSQRHRMMEAASGAGADDASVSSAVTSAASLSALEPVAPENLDDPAVAAEFQEVINSMKDARLEELPVSRRPSRPHHSAELEKQSSLASSVSEAPSQADTVMSSAMPTKRCIFCNFDSEDLDQNVIHMAKTHGLFIPEQDYLDDLEGLVTYLQAKVSENMECICCHKLKNTISAVQTHMRDKSHCRIAFDTDEEQLEIGQFYDFRGTYSDEEEASDDDDDDDKGEIDSGEHRGAKLGAARLATGENDNEDEGWEDESEDGSGNATATKKTQRNNNVAYQVDGELYLPSGRTAGHRSGMRYYKQNLRNRDTSSERAQQQLLTEGAHDPEARIGAKNPETALALRKAYEANRSQLVSRAEGGTGMRGVSAQVKRTLRAQEKQNRRTGERAIDQAKWRSERNRGKTGTGATGKRRIIHREMFV